FRKTPEVPNELFTRKAFIEQDNLFHKLSRSPFPGMREKGETIRRLAKCPVSGTPVAFECPDCGFPTHATKEDWEVDKDHDNYCDQLRIANVDEHDVRSGRQFPELEFPTGQDPECTVNMDSWDLLLFTRQFPPANSERSLRHVSNLLSYPMTVASVLYQFSPYILKNRLTIEGLKSLTALRFALHPKNIAAAAESLPSDRDLLQPVRIFIVGARSEASLPKFFWQQMAYMFPHSKFNIIFIGPEANIGLVGEAGIRQCKREDEARARAGLEPLDRSQKTVEAFSPQLTFITYPEVFQGLHESKTFVPYDPYYDVFFLFGPGLAYEKVQEGWRTTIKQLLDTKCAIFCTGYNEKDMKKDVNFIQDNFSCHYDILLTPGKHRFKSLAYEPSWFDPREIAQTNWGIYGIRGKRYQVRAAE
ncbi:Protein MSS51, mitochondrial, partial [Neolecta irregularis DAH-3]